MRFSMWSYDEATQYASGGACLISLRRTYEASNQHNNEGTALFLQHDKAGSTAITIDRNLKTCFIHGYSPLAALPAVCDAAIH